VIGATVGLVVATVFSIWVTIVFFVSRGQAFERLGTTYGTIVGLYYAGGLAAGILIGLASPLGRFLPGAALLGVVGVFPLYSAAAFLISQPAGLLSSHTLSTGATISILVGLPLGVSFWLDENPAPPWIQALQSPTLGTVGFTWLLALVLGGGSYFFLSRWTSSWPDNLMILVAMIVFVLPVTTALVTTFKFVTRG
jgi:hypothetical protein